MSAIEDELRATFARHEVLAPEVTPVKARIDIAWARTRRRRLARRITGAVAVVLMTGAAVPVAVDQWRHSGGSPVPVIDDLALGPAPAGPIDVLLLGSDNRVSWKDPANRRADTVMLIHVPADRSRTYLISLPRDGEVRPAGGPKVKLSETLFRGGPALTERTVTDLTGIDFDARVVVDFRALRAVTTAVGGVELCLTQPVKPAPSGPVHPKGCRHVGGDDVTPLLRARYGLRNGAYDRDRLGQQFLRALATKLTGDGTLADPARVDALLRAGREGIELEGDAGALLAGATALGSAEVVGVAEPTFNGNAAGRELIYPEVGPGLYAAVRGDTLEAWTDANPRYVQR